MASSLPPVILGVSLRCDRRAPRLARRAVEGALDADPVLEDARLVTSELVNNALLRSGCEADDIMRVMVRLDAGFLVISVHVPWLSPGPPRVSCALTRPGRDVDAEGLGLRVVEQIADRWGAEGPGEHRMWAAVALGDAA